MGGEGHQPVHGVGVQAHGVRPRRRWIVGHAGEAVGAPADRAHRAVGGHDRHLCVLADGRRGRVQRAGDQRGVAPRSRRRLGGYRGHRSALGCLAAAGQGDPADAQDENANKPTPHHSPTSRVDFSDRRSSRYAAKATFGSQLDHKPRSSIGGYHLPGGARCSKRRRGLRPETRDEAKCRLRRSWLFSYCSGRHRNLGDGFLSLRPSHAFAVVPLGYRLRFAGRGSGRRDGQAFARWGQSHPVRKGRLHRPSRCLPCRGGDRAQRIHRPQRQEHGRLDPLRRP